jgi:DNA-binding MarR family transcriptional regulator
VLKGQGPPGDIDELISSCQRLKVCTALAAIEQIDVGLLAKTLQLSTAALGEQITQLVAACHVCTRPDAEDQRHQWISLTDTGRTAYSGHVRALLAAPGNAQR